MVDWQKTGTNALSEVAKGRYFVSGSWNKWKLEEMTSDPANSSIFSLDVRLATVQRGGEFQIVRDMDWTQVLYPDGIGGVLGPDDQNLSGASWNLGAFRAGDKFKITLQRTVEGDKDMKSVSFASAGHVDLTAAEIRAATRPSYAIIGSWDGFSRPLEMDDAGDSFKYYVELGSEGGASFQIMVDGEVYKTLYPSKPDANPDMEHDIYGPNRPVQNVNWTIGPEAPGQRYEVRLLVDMHGSHSKVTWKKLHPRDKPKDGYFVKAP
jgi:hypothetical protein